VLVGLGLLGCTPNAIYLHGTNGSCVDEENAPAYIYNAKLKSLVDNFNNKFSTDSKFIFINSTSSDGKSSDGKSFSLLLKFQAKINLFISDQNIWASVVTDLKDRSLNR
jgi:hypothetical protein